MRDAEREARNMNGCEHKWMFVDFSSCPTSDNPSRTEMRCKCKKCGLVHDFRGNDLDLGKYGIVLK